MRRTLPQIIMLNHCAWVEQQNAERRSEARRKKDDQDSRKAELDPEVEEFGGAHLSELKGKELDAYLSDWSAFG